MLLYHYTSLSSLIGLLTTRELWASNIHYLSDGSEFGYALDRARGQLWEVAQTGGTTGIFAEQARQMLLSYERVNVFVASFSENGDLLSQWRAYCPAGKGVSFGVESSQIVAAAEAQGFKLVKCVYDPREQHDLISSLVRNLLSSYQQLQLKTEETERGIIERFAYGFASLAPHIKAPAFSEEREWRLVSGFLDSRNPRIAYREGPSFVVPYYRFQLPEENGKLQVGDFIVGPTPHPGLACSSIGSLAQSKGADWKRTAISQIPYRPW